MSFFFREKSGDLWEKKNQAGGFFFFLKKKKNWRGGSLKSLHFGMHNFILGDICGRVVQIFNGVFGFEWKRNGGRSV